MSFRDTSFMAAEESRSAWGWLRHQLAAFRLVFGTMFRADPIRTLALLVLRPAHAAGAIVAALWLKHIVESVVTTDGSAAFGAIGLGVTFALVLLCSWLTVVVEARLQERTAHEFDHRVARAVLRESSLELLDTPAYRDRLELLKDDSSSLPTTVTAVIDMCSATAATAVALGVLVSVDPLLVGLMAAAVPCLLVGKKAEAFRQRILIDTAEPTRETSDLFELATSPRAAKEVRTLGLGDELMSRYRTVSSDLVVARRRGWNMWAAYRSLAWTLFIAGFAVALAYVASKVSSGQASAGDIVLVVIVGAQVNIAVGALAYSVSFAIGCIHAVDRLMWIERAVRRGSRQSGAGSGQGDSRSTGLELRGLRFSYPDGTVAVDGITLSMPAGTVTAVVGENGAGKTTLVKLLARLYEPTDGEIVLDGASHHDVDAATWRERASGILQDYGRFELLARHAVGVGDLEQLDDQAAVAAAMERAGAPELMGEFPRGADTPLGASFGEGHEPSGGQWQKLALGRGMMRLTPRLLFLDEPVSALDPMAEHRLLLSYAKVCREQVRATGAVAVITSHRLPVVGLADQIVVLDKGRIVELGSHAELLAAGGSYADLFETQARGFDARPRTQPAQRPRSRAT